MSEKKLKPCPFCGVKPKRIKGTDDPYVSHMIDCYMRRYGGGNWLGADDIQAWGKRAK
jgi:hypothetical protein